MGKSTSGGIETFDGGLVSISQLIILNEFVPFHFTELLLKYDNTHQMLSFLRLNCLFKAVNGFFNLYARLSCWGIMNNV